MKNSKAYDAGFEDGQTWVSENEGEEIPTSEWNDSLINALGPTETGKILGVNPRDSEKWAKALDEYSRGCIDGARYMAGEATE